MEALKKYYSLIEDSKFIFGSIISCCFIILTVRQNHKMATFKNRVVPGQGQMSMEFSNHLEANKENDVKIAMLAALTIDIDLFAGEWFEQVWF